MPTTEGVPESPCHPSGAPHRHVTTPDSRPAGASLPGPAIVSGSLATPDTSVAAEVIRCAGSLSHFVSQNLILVVPLRPVRRPECPRAIVAAPTCHRGDPLPLRRGRARA